MDIQLKKSDAIAHWDAVADRLCDEIRATQDFLNIRGRTFYVSNAGDDTNDGMSPVTPWKTVERINQTELSPGDAVLFCRGDVFRSVTITAQTGVTYGAYGVGPKPLFCGWSNDLAHAALWEETDPVHHIWHCTQPILDVGTLVFNDGEACAKKLIPSYIDGRFVCRNDESKPFDMAEEMRQDLDMYRQFEGEMTCTPSHGQQFPVPVENQKSFGDLYLRCDLGNPGDVFFSIEALPRRSAFRIREAADVHIDNLCLKFFGHHAISASGHVKELHVTNCEIGWIGGTIQHYLGTDPNYPEGGRGSVTRFGNGVEIYGGCEDYLVEHCYIYQCYDAGITHQITTNGKKYTMNHIRYRNNLVEKCVYSIEYFLDMNMGDEQSLMSDVIMEGNVLRLAGYGWGQQRHNVDTPAHIKGWNYVNRCENYHIRSNVFDRCAYRLLHLVAKEKSSLPAMQDNIYIQYADGMLGEYGANGVEKAQMIYCDDMAETAIKETFGDTGGRYYPIFE